MNQAEHQPRTVFGANIDAGPAYARLDQICSDRVVRVHNEGQPDQYLETLDKAAYFVATAALSDTINIEGLLSEEAVA